MADIASTHRSRNDELRSESPVRECAKESWSKPEIVDYQPVTVAHGINRNIGDGINNLS